LSLDYVNRKLTAIGTENAESVVLWVSSDCARARGAGLIGVIGVMGVMGVNGVEGVEELAGLGGVNGEITTGDFTSAGSGGGVTGDEKGTGVCSDVLRGKESKCVGVVGATITELRRGNASLPVLENCNEKGTKCIHIKALHFL
jgi:hypothetical protein